MGRVHLRQVCQLFTRPYRPTPTPPLKRKGLKLQTVVVPSRGEMRHTADCRLRDFKKWRILQQVECVFTPFTLILTVPTATLKSHAHDLEDRVASLQIRQSQQGREAAHGRSRANQVDGLQSLRLGGQNEGAADLAPAR